MTVKTRVILIPFWIEESLKRAGFPVKDCIDYKKVKTTVSTNDQLSFLAAQEVMGTLVGGKSLGFGSAYNLTCCWQESVQAEGGTVKADLDSLHNVACAQTYQDEVKTRLYTPGTNGPDYNPTYEKPFIIYDLMPDVIGVVVYPGFFTEIPDKQLQLSLAEAVHQALYVYNTPYHEMASTSWFKRFLELLVP